MENFKKLPYSLVDIRFYDSIAALDFYGGNIFPHQGFVVFGGNNPHFNIRQGRIGHDIPYPRFPVRLRQALVDVYKNQRVGVVLQKPDYAVLVPDNVGLKFLLNEFKDYFILNHRRRVEKKNFLSQKIRQIAIAHRNMVSQNRMKYKLHFFIILTVCILGSCTQSPPAQSEFVLGTVCTVNLYRYGSSPVYGKIFSRLKELEGMFSANSANSILSVINAAAGIEPVPAGEDLIRVLERALYFARVSGGAFDPTIGPLVRLWGIGTENAGVPGDREIEEALSLVNWRDVHLDRERGMVFLARPGMALDLGAIANGYAADEVVKIIAAAGIPFAVIDLGGNIYAYGEKEENRPWRIGIQNPLEPRGIYLGVLEWQKADPKDPPDRDRRTAYAWSGRTVDPLADKTVVTSGIYERFFEYAGRNYHHILSTQDGYPAETGLLSVTVIAENSMDADALSTAAFALGWEKGSALIKAQGAEAVFVLADKRIRCSPGAAAVFTLSDTSYSLAE
jgi:thiamine biosynthesis lipoprotein